MRILLLTLPKYIYCSICGPNLIAMSNTERQQAIEEERHLGSWPRRLLHVQSMRSCRWEPGNIYGGVREPRYNALSYTWGRWAIEPEEASSVTGLELEGVTWTIPRVNPQHFTVDSFADVIKQAAYIVSQDDTDSGTASDAVEFVWVDIACIDQSFSAESMLEIGRQAAIFRGATSVYVWLCRMSNDQLSEAAWQTQSFNNDAMYEATPISMTQDVYQAVLEQGDEVDFSLDEAWFNQVLAFLTQMLGEPWFTSLWTLQEAFLRKDAIFLSTSGDYIDLCDDEEDEESPTYPFSLRTILSMCETLRLCIERNTQMGRVSGDKAVRKEILLLLDSSGFNALNHDNPMELYRAATNRKPSNDLDAVYGIMQIFEFRLGHSSLDTNTEAVFTLADLEDQLGAALMELSPVLSQCFRRQVPVSRKGENWRVSRLSSAPSPGFASHMPWEPELYKSDCRLSPIRVDGLTWGSFRGKACSFAVLEQAWSYVLDAYKFANDSMGRNGLTVADLAPWANGGSAMFISLDFAPDLFEEWDSMQPYDVPRGIVQHSLARRLLDEFKDADLVVLHLGLWTDDQMLSDPMAWATVQFGLILLRPFHGKKSTSQGSKDPTWRRLGICSWEPSYFSRESQSPTILQRRKDGDWVRLPEEQSSREPLSTRVEADDSWATSEAWFTLEGIFG